MARYYRRKNRGRYRYRNYRYAARLRKAAYYYLNKGNAILRKAKRIAN